MARPREQHQYKNGTWSAGKPVSMKRLATSAATMKFLLEQDRAAAAKIRQARDWNGRLRYSMGEAALFELAGHPHVVDEAGATMEVVQGEPELVVDEHEGGCARAGASNLNLTVKSAAEWLSTSGRLEVDEGRTLRSEVVVRAVQTRAPAPSSR